FAIGEELIEKVKAATGARMGGLLSRPPVRVVETANRIEKKRVDIVVMGVSTGGPQALRWIIPRFPADCPVPIAMVLHMPVGYTELYAKKLDEISQLVVHEAQHGERLRPGVSILAPAGLHLSFHRAADGAVITHLDT